jgi:hypothetical protein
MDGYEGYDCDRCFVMQKDCLPLTGDAYFLGIHYHADPYPKQITCYAQMKRQINKKTTILPTGWIEPALHPTVTRVVEFLGLCILANQHDRYPQISLSWLLGGPLKSDARHRLGWMEHKQIVYAWNIDVPPREEYEGL